MPARHVVGFRSLIHHLVHGQGEKVTKHDIDDWTQAGHRRTYSDARETRFGDGRIEHPFAAKLLHQPG